MSSAPSIAEPPADPLRLTVCPRCAYSLVGLPPEGICPECGTAYDPSDIILHGSARGELADLGNASTKTLIGMGVFAAMQWWVFWAPGNLLENGSSRWLAGAYLAIGFVLAVGRRLSATAPGLVEIRLTPKECSQRDAVPEFSSTALLLRWWIQLLPICAALIWAAVFGKVFPFVTKPILAAATLIYVVAMLWRVYSAGRAPRQWWSVIAWIHAIGAPKETRAEWPAVGGVILRRAASGRFHLQVRTPSSWKNRAGDVVNADVACTPEQAEALRARTHAWRFGSRDARAVAAPAASPPARGVASVAE